MMHTSQYNHKGSYVQGRSSKAISRHNHKRNMTSASLYKDVEFDDTLAMDDLDNSNLRKRLGGKDS